MTTQYSLLTTISYKNGWELCCKNRNTYNTSRATVNVLTCFYFLMDIKSHRRAVVVNSVGPLTKRETFPAIVKSEREVSESRRIIMRKSNWTIIAVCSTFNVVWYNIYIYIYHARAILHRHQKRENFFYFTQCQLGRRTKFHDPPENNVPSSCLSWPRQVRCLKLN